MTEETYFSDPKPIEIFAIGANRDMPKIIRIPELSSQQLRVFIKKRTHVLSYKPHSIKKGREKERWILLKEYFGRYMLFWIKGHFGQLVLNLQKVHQ